MKEIWVPKSETNVTVQDGKVWVTETMKMSPKPIETQKTGFSK